MAAALGQLHAPRLIIGAGASDSGKTTLTLGLIAALRRRGLAVCGAKVGPDFIDAAHVAQASGRPARNLDAWLCPESVVLDSFVRGFADADIAIIEGVMGLFDGRHGSGEGSTAHVARLLGAPVLLVLDCAKSASTVGAVAYGLKHYDSRLKVSGAILNRVASAAHGATVRAACEKAGVPVLGVIQRDERLMLKSRHLGLTEPGSDDWRSTLEVTADVLTEQVDLDALLAIARDVTPLVAPPQRLREAQPVRVALARDEAFWFYDEASLEILRDGGAELIEYAPMRDPFPDVAAAFIGGGYPELYAYELMRNTRARDGLLRAIQAGMPVYAECGGLMYLTQRLTSGNGEFEMVAGVPAMSTMSKRRSALRYVEAQATEFDPFFVAGQCVRGHEFHYSQTHYDQDRPAFAIDGQPEGYSTASLHASYVHVHLASVPTAVERFLASARQFAGVK